MRRESALSKEASRTAERPLGTEMHHLSSYFKYIAETYIKP
jgi:hypothetical protein